MTDEVADKPAETPAPVAETTEQNRIVPNISGAIPEDEVARITADLIGVLKTVYDPEIPVDIYELGLIYKVDINDDRHVDIEMTLTAPACPVAGVSALSCQAAHPERPMFSGRGEIPPRR